MRGPVPEPVSAAGDCHPGLSPNDGRRDGGLTAGALPVGGLDPLERRLVTRELHQLALRVEDVRHPPRAAPLLKRVQVEPDHVRLCNQPRVHPAAPVERRGVGVKVVRQRQEREPADAGRRGRQRVRRDVRPVRLVVVEPADDARTRAAVTARGAGRVGRAVQLVQLALQVPAGVEREEVDAGAERIGVLPGTDRIEHHREPGVSVEEDRAVRAADVHLRVGDHAGRRDVHRRLGALPVVGDRADPDAVGDARVEADQRCGRAAAGNADGNPRGRNAEVDDPVGHTGGHRRRGLPADVRAVGGERSRLQVRDLERRADRLEGLGARRNPARVEGAAVDSARVHLARAALERLVRRLG